MDQHGAAVGHPRTPVADVRARRPVAVCTVDVEHVDRPVDVGERIVGELADVADPVTDTGPLEVCEEHRVVVGGGIAVAVDLLWPTVVAGVRIDRDHRHVRRRCAGQHDRGTTLEAADLDDRAPGRAPVGAVVER